jgi:competence protein ComEA
MGNRKTSEVKREKKRGDFFCKAGELSAYQKMTLGIPLNLNSETPEGLTAIPGIGKSLAGRIVKERIKRDGFKDIIELRSVSGIGEKTFLKIAPHVSL